jgi:hypothetical protein
MLRTAALAFVVLPLVLVANGGAAPVPPPSAKEVAAKIWGKTAGDGEFEPKGKEITLRTTFGKPNHTFSWNDERLTVPRTERVIRGDFEITVRVLEAVPPLKDAKDDTGQHQTSAGLYIRGAQMSLRYHLHQSYQRFPGANQDLQRWFGIEANYPRGGAGGSIGISEEGKSVYLRLTRKGKDLTMSHSFDGEKWSTPNNPFANIDMSIPDELTVGVYLSHSTYQFAHATFDHFTIEKPKTEKPK